MNIEKNDKRLIPFSPVEEVFKDGNLTQYGKMNNSIYDRLGETSNEFFEKLPQDNKFLQILLKILPIIEIDYFNNKNFNNIVSNYNKRWIRDAFKEIHDFLINNKANKNILHKFLDDWGNLYESFFEAKKQKIEELKKLNSVIAKKAIEVRQEVILLMFKSSIEIIVNKISVKEAQQVRDNQITQITNDVSQNFEIEDEHIEIIFSSIINKFMDYFSKNTGLDESTDNKLAKLELTERDIKELKEIKIEPDYEKFIVLLRNKIEKFMNQKIKLVDLTEILPKFVEKFHKDHCKQNKTNEVKELEKWLNENTEKK